MQPNTIKLLGLLILTAGCAPDRAADPIPNGASFEKTTITDHEAYLTALEIDLYGVVAAGERFPLTAIATFGDGVLEDMTDRVIWTVADESIASVDAYSILTAHDTGVTTITASYHGFDSDPKYIRVQDAPAPNLWLQAAQVATTPGASSLTVTVANDGLADSAAFSIDVALDPAAPSGFGLVGDLHHDAPALSAGESYAWTVDLTVQAGGHDLYVVVDSEEWVTEEREDDNLETVSFDALPEGPDLVVDSFTWRPRWNSLVDFEVRIVNLGDETSKGFWVDLYANPPADLGAFDAGERYAWVEGLAPGEETTLSFNGFDYDGDWWEFGFMAAIQIDSWANVDESDEGNNIDIDMVLFLNNPFD